MVLVDNALTHANAKNSMTTRKPRVHRVLMQTAHRPRLFVAKDVLISIKHLENAAERTVNGQSNRIIGPIPDTSAVTN